MGCWNETCGITQMPIEGGDKVRMFLIVENEWASSRPVLHYSSDLWKPFGLPLKGTYDEYGRIENIEQDVFTDLMLEHLKKIIVAVPNRMGEVFDPDKLDWETVIDFLTDEGLRVTSPSHLSFVNVKLDALLQKMKELVPDLPDNGWSSERSDLAKQQKQEVSQDKHVFRMYHMMVHEDVYQALVDYKVPAERFSSWTNGDLRAEMERDAKQYLADIRSRHAKMKDASLQERMALDLEKLLDSYNTQNRFLSAAHHLNDRSGSGEYLSKYLKFVENKIQAGASDDDIEIKNLTNQFIDFVCFNQAMSLLRKMWLPQSGKGGQDREFVLHKYLGEVISSFSEKKMKQWEEDYEEDEE